jgi:hypothetical protein
MPTQLDDYLFDLQGYLKLKNALTPEEVGEANRHIDAIPRIGRNEWYGYIHREDHVDERGISFQQIYEAGKVFETLIDHPSWINHLLHYIGGQDNFDSHHGPLFIDENFASIRGPGEAIYLHSGGHTGCKRTQFRYRNGGFHCGQINILIALTDIGPGDGGTMVIPGSHKSNIEHPRLSGDTHLDEEEISVDNVEAAQEVHMNAGDALLFVDAISHGSAKRIKSGDRRILVYRYGPSWGNFRWGYTPSKELLKRLTPSQRKLVQPQTYRNPPPEALKAAGL